ncbi:chymotrypsin-2-like [Belonocnema kinseyi]|uniref:chymotrypsin-2-like n=1 Tax=Belonocnema kinseyi TaxID=2817044 RepID=UPI00143D96A2|nr:chymotrypsin-2-like [Belonocnema kinseyi]
MKRSIGGLAARVNYQVCLVRAPHGFFWYGGGGSIVSNYYVLTAAHCVDEPPTSYLSIRAGSLYCFSGGSLHTPKQIIKHPGYRGPGTGLLVHDIALIQVIEPLSGPNIAVIPLSGGETPPNTFGTVSGWGKVYGSPYSNMLPEILQASTVPIYSKETCRMYRTSNPFEDQICAGTLTATACHGDSGGPLVYNGAQVGIVSYGPVACGIIPTFFTEVSQYISWIQTYAV